MSQVALRGFDVLRHHADDSAVRISDRDVRILLGRARRVTKRADAVELRGTQRLRDEAKGEFPERVTAFRKEMAVHGKFGKPCPVCGTNVQRIRYAENETNYCPRCQTGGKLLADRALSRLLKNDWPKSIDELERL